MSCYIQTNDGYEKYLPYDPEQENWNIGDKVVVHHAEENWTAQYTIVDLYSSHVANVPSVDPIILKFYLEFDKSVERVYLKNPAHDEIWKKMAQDIADEIDKDILDKMIQICGINKADLLKKP